MGAFDLPKGWEIIDTDEHDGFGDTYIALIDPAGKRVDSTSRTGGGRNLLVKVAQGAEYMRAELAGGGEIYTRAEVTKLLHDNAIVVRHQQRTMVHTRQQRIIGQSREAVQAAATLAQAMRLTQEYLGDATLPSIGGWSWFDAMERYGHFERYLYDNPNASDDPLIQVDSIWWSRDEARSSEVEIVDIRRDGRVVFRRTVVDGRKLDSLIERAEVTVTPWQLRSAMEPKPEPLICDGCGEAIPAGEERKIGYHVMHATQECEEKALHAGDWTCGDCQCRNRAHDAFCYRCGAGQPEEDDELRERIRDQISDATGVPKEYLIDGKNPSSKALKPDEHA